MLKRFWNWLWDEEARMSPTEDLLTREIEWLRGELQEANRRVFILTKRLGKPEERPAIQSPMAMSDPISIRRKPIEVRRAELEKASQDRLAPMQPETKASVAYWADKIAQTESSALEELERLEDSIHGKEDGQSH